jgi:ABC-type polysaccharide/polyol phosphate transport system ATPase subunit
VRGVSTTVRGAETAAVPVGAPSRPLALSACRVGKTFRLPRERTHTLKQRALHPLRARLADDLHALQDVSFEVAQGEFFGVVGRNGSGKSTLLKCLAGIYATDQGALSVNGRLAPFIELGVGFNPELTARENAIINAVMLGLSRKQALARLEEIVAFAELEEFMELKLKNYSSGMHVRLAFAVAVQVDADILLIDEVLAVGDARFQRKCYSEFARLKEAGRTIVFVTHDMGAVERFCDRAMLLERGRALAIGDPHQIAERYNELSFRRAREEARATGGPEVLRREPVAAIIGARFEDLDGQAIVHARQSEPCVARVQVRFHADACDPMFALALLNDAGSIVFATSSNLVLGDTGTFAAGEEATVRVRFDNFLSPGRYRLVATVTGDGSAENAYDLREDIASIIVDADRSGGGVVDLPHRFEVQRA